MYLFCSECGPSLLNCRNTMLPLSPFEPVWCRDSSCVAYLHGEKKRDMPPRPFSSLELLPAPPVLLAESYICINGKVVINRDFPSVVALLLPPFPGDKKSCRADSTVRTRSPFVYLFLSLFGMYTVTCPAPRCLIVYHVLQVPPE